MKKEEKTALVDDLKARLGRASLALVSEYKGMTAGETADVRRKLRAARGEMRVAKANPMPKPNQFTASGRRRTRRSVTIRIIRRPLKNRN